METEILVLIGQMEILAVLILIGLFAQKSGLMNETNINSMSDIIAKLILPCMLFTMIGGGGTRDELFGMWKFLIACILLFVIAISVGFILSRIIGLSQPAKNMHILVTAFGNGGYVGIPVIAAMFPDNSGLAIAVYSMVEAVFYWVFGPMIVDTSGSRKIDLKKVFTPLTISVLLGILVLLLNLKPENNVVWDTLSNVGSTTKYFAAIYIGLDLGRKGFKKMTANPKVFTAAPFKLVILPVIIYLVFGKTGFIEGDLLTMLVLFMATPTGMSLPIVARIAGSDDAYATSGTMVCTILCLFTMPFVLWLISHF